MTQDDKQRDQDTPPSGHPVPDESDQPAASDQPGHVPTPWELQQQQRGRQETAVTYEPEPEEAGTAVADEERGGQPDDEYQWHTAKSTRSESAETDAVEFIDVKKAFGRNTVLNGLNLGIPDGQSAPPTDNQPDAARRSVEEIAALASDVNVRVALEVMPNKLSSAASICHLIEEQLDGLDVGVCLDYGHAHLMGDLGDAIETVSGHLWTTHVHDNDGRQDDHRVPFAGRIGWDAAIMETQKIGYDGVLMFEVADTGDPIEVLKRTVKARERLEHMFVVF